MADIPAPAPTPARPVKAPRDYRLDFFRGLALVFIFIDHIPDNRLSNLTLKAYALSDAAEVFIFISGYTAAMVYGRVMLREGRLMCAARIWRRVWQLYVAHLAIFMIYNAEVAYTMQHFNNPLFADELQVGAFLNEPADTIFHVLTLQFQPSLLNILPLYIVLMLAFPLFLVAMRHSLAYPLLASFLLYVTVQFTELNLPGYPADTEWYFNPLSYQFLFVIAATFGYAQAVRRRLRPDWKFLVPLAAAILLAGAAIQGSWTLHGLFPAVRAFPGLPEWVAEKSRLAPLRIVSLLAMALLVARLIPRHAAFLTSRLGWPLILCGQNSLYVFSLTILLTVIANMLMTLVGHGVIVQLALTMAGLSLMIAFSTLLAWFSAGGHFPVRPRALPG